MCSHCCGWFLPFLAQELQQLSHYLTPIWPGADLTWRRSDLTPIWPDANPHLCWKKTCGLWCSPTLSIGHCSTPHSWAPEGVDKSLPEQDFVPGSAIPTPEPLWKPLDCDPEEDGCHKLRKLSCLNSRTSKCTKPLGINVKENGGEHSKMHGCTRPSCYFHHFSFPSNKWQNCMSRLKTSKPNATWILSDVWWNRRTPEKTHTDKERTY